MITDWYKSARSHDNGNCVEVRGLGSAWAKSSHSSGNGNCVEARRLDAVEVRDTKDRDGGTLSFSPGSWTAFLDGLRAGDFA